MEIKALIIFSKCTSKSTINSHVYGGKMTQPCLWGHVGNMRKYSEHVNIHTSITHNSQRGDTTQVSLN